ncbi:MAG: fibronectin type III domain-containing protein [Oscillospiraceae bacterium]|nr:fibronectin type III domain-containing protein [Oscillospiraceae bacterium]
MKSNLKKAVALLLCLFTMFTVVQTSAFALPTTTLTQAVAKPSQVKNVKATAGTNYVTLTWSKASNTTKYYVFSYNTSTKKYTCLGNTTKLTYKISNLKANTTYRFAVQAARVVSGKYYYGKVSAYVTVKTKGTSSSTTLGQVTGLKVNSIGTDYVTLSWNAVSGAQKYYVFQYNFNTGKYVSLGSITDTACKINRLEPYTNYRFAVQAAKTVNGKTYYGKLSSYVSVTTKSEYDEYEIDRVTGLEVTAIGTDYVSLSWNAAEGAEDYCIYQYDTLLKKYVYLGYVDTTYCKVNSLNPGTTYVFAVAGRRITDEQIYWGDFSSDVTVTTKSASSSTVTKPAKVTNVKATASTTSVSLTWSAASGAQKYYVFTYNTSTKKYTCIGNTTSCSYKASNLKSNTTYNFAVQAAKTVNGKTYYGTVSNYVTVKTKSTVTKPAAVTGLKITTSGKSNYLKITWKAVSGASGYQVYRSTTGKSGSYSRIATVGSGTLSYANSGLSSSTPYYYAVRAYKSTSNGTLYGEFTSVNLSTRLSRDGLKKIIKEANKCYWDWALGYALYDSLIKWDYIEMDDAYSTRYYRVNSSSIKSISDVKAKMLPYFSASICNNELYGKHSHYIERNGKLYLGEDTNEDILLFGKHRIDSISCSDTKCVFKATMISTEYGYYEDSDTYTLIYSNGRWIYTGNTVFLSASLYNGDNPWLN